MKPVLLGAVAGTRTRDAEVLTRSCTPTNACDWTSDYAMGHATELDEHGPSEESRTDLAASE
jgi:hypothetical protein